MSPYVIRHGRRIEVETLDTGVIAKPKRRQPKGKPFAIVPLDWAAEAAKATNSPGLIVCAQLLHLAWKAKSRTVILSSTHLGVSVKVKSRVLRNLKAARLIEIEHRDGRSPKVTLLGPSPWRAG
jgi:hypothetical protein